MEHPEEYLIKQKNLTLLRSIYGLVFNELPTYNEIVNGTPELSIPYKLYDEFKNKKSLAVTLTELEAKPMIEFCIKLAGIISHFEKPPNYQALPKEILQSSSP